MRPHEFDNAIREMIVSDPLPGTPVWSEASRNEDGTYTIVVVTEDGKTYRLDGRKWVDG